MGVLEDEKITEFENYIPVGHSVIDELSGSFQYIIF